MLSRSFEYNIIIMGRIMWPWKGPVVGWQGSWCCSSGCRSSTPSAIFRNYVRPYTRIAGGKDHLTIILHPTHQEKHHLYRLEWRKLMRKIFFKHPFKANKNSKAREKIRKTVIVFLIFYIFLIALISFLL